MAKDAIKIVTIVGARPQFIKAWAVSRVIRLQPEVFEVLVHTGQHFDPEMSDVFFNELDIPKPAYNLGVHGGDNGEMIGRMLESLERVMRDEKPQWVLVYGDTNSTLAGALAATKLHIPVAHVEAGLRSFNRRMPEETNRVVTDHLSALLFCPTRRAVTNLRNEGILDGVHLVGDVMHDVSLRVKGLERRRSSILERFNLMAREFALATVHRAENTDDPAQLARVVAYLREQAKLRPVVLPLHPRTRNAIAQHGIALDGLIVMDPVSYLEMAFILSACAVVFTDSGGVQKEAYFHRKPCVTLRAETEWVETIECGWNRLWSEPGYAPRKDIADYGNGDAAEHVVRILLASESAIQAGS